MMRKEQAIFLTKHVAHSQPREVLEAPIPQMSFLHTINFYKPFLIIYITFFSKASTLDDHAMWCNMVY